MSAYGHQRSTGLWPPGDVGSVSQTPKISRQHRRTAIDPEPTVTKPDRVTAMQRLRPFAIEPLDRVAWREAVIARSRYHDVALYNATLGG